MITTQTKGGCCLKNEKPWIPNGFLSQQTCQTRPTYLGTNFHYIFVWKAFWGRRRTFKIATSDKNCVECLISMKRWIRLAYTFQNFVKAIKSTFPTGACSGAFVSVLCSHKIIILHVAIPSWVSPYKLPNPMQLDIYLANIPSSPTKKYAAQRRTSTLRPAPCWLTTYNRWKR